MHNFTENPDTINQAAADGTAADGATADDTAATTRPPAARCDRSAAQDGWTRAYRLAHPDHPENRRRRNFWRAASDPRTQARVRKLALSRPNPLNF